MVLQILHSLSFWSLFQVEKKTLGVVDPTISIYHQDASVSLDFRNFLQHAGGNSWTLHTYRTPIRPLFYVNPPKQGRNSNQDKSHQRVLYKFTLIFWNEAHRHSGRCGLFPEGNVAAKRLPFKFHGQLEIPLKSTEVFKRP